MGQTGAKSPLGPSHLSTFENKFLEKKNQALTQIK